MTVAKVSTNNVMPKKGAAGDHYTHLTYAVQRRAEAVTDPADAVSSSVRRLVTTSEDALRAQPSLPPLRLICGFAISEDGFMMSRFVTPPRSGIRGLDTAPPPVLSPGAQNAAGGSERVFTATVTNDGGVPRISMPSTRAGGAAGDAVEDYSQAASAPDAEPWQLLVRAARSVDLTENDLALLDWTSIGRLFAHFRIGLTPINRARTELDWRKRHDRALLVNSAGAAERLAQSFLRGVTAGEFGRDSKRELALTAEQAQEEAAREFARLVEQLYPRPPIMEAAGGAPVLLVRTAPQGEIAVNPVSASPRNPNAGAGASGSVMGESSLSPTLHQRERPTPQGSASPRVFLVPKQKLAGPQSSPLKHPAYGS